MGAGESREERNAGERREESKATTALAVGASVGLAAGAIYSLLASGSSNSNCSGKMMKAPGQKGVTIPRDDFEDNPQLYFSDQREKAKKASEGKK
ncbi:hypothetical protein AAC387_Pa03g0773 [Persea americana]